MCVDGVRKWKKRKRGKFDFQNVISYTRKERVSIIGGQKDMGIYLNAGYEKFARTVRSKIYIDKTGLLEYINSVIDTDDGYICLSRPRRFGKSIAAAMLSAYYGRGENAKKIFDSLAIAKAENYAEHLNQYDVIHIDMAEMWSNVGKKEELFLSTFNKTILEELQKEYSMVDISECSTIAMALSQISHVCKAQFVVIIDEWDTVFREAKQNKKLQDEYISLLRALFKGESSKRFIALAYMTGILPIKKYGIESALNNFDEYTMISPKMLAKYYGFTSDEVQRLCEQYGMEFDKMCEWYDGYSFKNAEHIYNPNSVVKAIRFEAYESYWSHTEAFSSLSGYISLNFEGLRDDIIRMFAGERCRVKVGSFENDFVSYKSKDDVMTALIHLGYLAYDLESKEAYIPNKEVQEAFRKEICRSSICTEEK